MGRGSRRGTGTGRATCVAEPAFFGAWAALRTLDPQAAATGNTATTSTRVKVRRTIGRSATATVTRHAGTAPALLTIGHIVSRPLTGAPVNFRVGDFRAGLTSAS